ncbi:MAG: calcium/sodium antiporter [Pseudomonadota bacterium]
MFELPAYQVGLLAFGSVAFGLYLLIKGGDWTIDAATFIAERAGLSPLFIGATIVSFGTSVPELFTSVNANLSGYPGIALGNVVGSNIANVLLVLGVTAMIFPIAAKRSSLVKDLGMMLVATAILAIGMLAGVIPAWAGAAMFALLVSFVAYQYATDTLEIEEVAGEHAISSVGGAMAVLGGGLVALALGSELLVQGAVVAGTAIGVPEAIIGLTVVAFGTSLPELATCVAAARQRATDLILGNIIGSNTFNVLSIIAITAMIKPLDVDQALMGFDLWFMVGVAVAFTAWMLVVGRLAFVTGIAMVALYVGFVVLQYRGSVLF